MLVLGVGCGPSVVSEPQGAHATAEIDSSSQQHEPVPPNSGTDRTAPVESASTTSANDAVDYHIILDLLSPKQTGLAEAADTIDSQWHPGNTVMLVETLRFTRRGESSRIILSLLKRKTKQSYGRDLDRWFQWIWTQPYQPHPHYAEFKSDLYSRVDQRFSEYFRNVEKFTIRLDEIRWGGVQRDGIPPLKNPKMLPAHRATYLADSDIVFGVKLDEDIRCYPKRILAWHEMFKDTIAGQAICGVY